MGADRFNFTQFTDLYCETESKITYDVVVKGGIAAKLKVRFGVITLLTTRNTRRTLPAILFPMAGSREQGSFPHP